MAQAAPGIASPDATPDPHATAAAHLPEHHWSSYSSLPSPFPNTSMLKVLRRPVESALTSSITVVHQLFTNDGMITSLALPQRQAQRDPHRFHDLRCLRVPGDDPLGKYIDDERDLHPPGVGHHVGEVPVQKIRPPVLRLVVPVS